MKTGHVCSSTRHLWPSWLYSVPMSFALLVVFARARVALSYTCVHYVHERILLRAEYVRNALVDDLPEL